MEHNAELKEFLRSRRARLNVDDMPIGGTGGVRRVPGLRREEVAQLAGVRCLLHTPSVDLAALPSGGSR